MISKIMRHVPWAWRARRIAQGIHAARQIDQYLSGDWIKKLHLGCGANLLAGWLNTDSQAAHDEVVFLDATQALPVAAGSFDYIFSEHMIEHISHGDGLRMLKECYKALKPGGRIRISTPDLQFLIDLYAEEKNELQTNYIRWSAETFAGVDRASDTMVINNFVRDWGHLFIYDEKTLRASLSEAGFADITAYKINASDDHHLSNLENVSRMPDGFLELESFTLEATKPS